MIINVGLVVGLIAMLMSTFTQTCLAQSNANISGIQKGNQTTTSSSTIPTTTTKPITLQGTSTNDKFKVEVNWTPNDISKENTFDIKFLDSKSGKEIKGVTYDIVLLTGDKKLAETYRSAQTATQQKYIFGDQGSYILNIDKINNSPAESVNIPIQVTPEFPVNVLALMAIAALGLTIISSRLIRIIRRI
jgi:hypothetical protein